MSADRNHRDDSDVADGRQRDSTGRTTVQSARLRPNETGSVGVVEARIPRILVRQERRFGRIAGNYDLSLPFKLFTVLCFIVVRRVINSCYGFGRLGRTREFPNPRHGTELGLPQLQVRWLFVHDTTPADARHDPVHVETDPPEDHHRRHTVRENVRSRPGHQVHVRVEQAQRLSAKRVRRDHGVGKGRLRVHGLPEHRVGRPDDQTQRQRHEHIRSWLVEPGHSPSVQFPRGHTSKGRRFKHIFETKAPDNIDDRG